MSALPDLQPSRKFLGLVVKEENWSRLRRREKATATCITGTQLCWTLLFIIIPKIKILKHNQQKKKITVLCLCSTSSLE